MSDGLTQNTLKWEPNEDVKDCALCNIAFKQDEEFSFVIIKSLRFPTTQSLELTVKAAHKDCLTKYGCKLAGAAGQIWTLPSPK